MKDLCDCCGECPPSKVAEEAGYMLLCLLCYRAIRDEIDRSKEER